MAESLTAEQLYKDLVQAHQRPEIPDGAFTARKFADDADISPQAANEALVKMVKAGTLKRLWVRRRYWYYFLGAKET